MATESELNDPDWLTGHSEQVLARHEPSCVATVVEEAYALGIDTSEAARVVASQLLEDKESACMCVGDNRGRQV